MILTGSEDNLTLETLRELFPSTSDQLETYRFSKIHKIVLGLLSCDLGETIATDRVEIDTPDSFGRTALSWAVRRQDSLSTELLLKAKSDPNSTNNLEDAPLFHAVVRGNLTCVNLLLNAGASTTQANSYHSSILHYAVAGMNKCCSTPYSPTSIDCTGSKIVKLLILSGVDVERQTCCGYTPLMSSADADNVHAMQVLLDYGAEINHLDLEGNSSIMNSILGCSKNATQLLLQSQANYTLVNKTGSTTLHYAARGGDLETLDILRSANLIGINPYSQNTDGKTAIELAYKRSDRPDGFINLLLTLIFEICNRNDHLNGSQRANHTGVVDDNASEDCTDSTEVGQGVNIPGAWPSH